MALSKREHNKLYESKPKNRCKTLATKRVYNAVSKGKLKRGIGCSECGSVEHIHAHHDDYTKPLEVRWLCCVCHAKWHVQHGEAKLGTAPNGRGVGRRLKIWTQSYEEMWADIEVLINKKRVEEEYDGKS